MHGTVILCACACCGCSLHACHSPLDSGGGENSRLPIQNPHGDSTLGERRARARGVIHFAATHVALQSLAESLQSVSLVSLACVRPSS